MHLTRTRVAVASSLSLGLLATACGSSQHAPVAAVSTSARPAARTTHAAKPATRTPSAPPTSRTATPTTTAPTPAAPLTPHGAPITLAFGGDVHFMGVDASRLAADPATALGPIASVLQGADLAMVNLESAITTRGTPAAKQYVFRAPASAFTALRAAGVDVVTMANNHGEDYGPVGLADSLASAAAAAFPVVGIGVDRDAAFSPYNAVVKGQRVAIIGATQVLDGNLAAAWSAGPGKPGLASAYDVPRLLEAVRAARASADTVVVYLHWGKELAGCPTSSQHTIAQQLVDAGADIVVGSHAHVQLGAGRLGSGFVDYGLGNFVFYAHGSGAVTRSGVLLLTVAGRVVTGSRWVPARIQSGIPVPLAGNDATRAVEQWAGLVGCTGLLPLT